MANIIARESWRLPERLVTPEKIYRNRRAFLRQIGFLGGTALMATNAAETTKGYPYPRKKEFELPNLRLTDEKVAISYNNFYEFSTNKQLVRSLTGKFVIDPWSVEIGGLCEKPMKVDVRELVDTMPMDERVYRFRCVEGWSMVVPWTGFELRKLIEKVQPKAEAKFLRFVTFNRPDQAPGFEMYPNYPWPYTEGLRMDEAMHPLTMVATGLYGKPMPKQNGAPIRIVVPWKYGYKSIKSIVKIEFVDKQPATLWETLQPDEYPFESNVNPDVPHPRWSQATERVIDTGDRIRTKMFNGYGDQVAKLYAKK